MNAHFYWPILIIGLSIFAFIAAKAKAKKLRKNKRLASLPSQYGLWLMLWCVISLIVVGFAFSVFGNSWIKWQAYQDVAQAMVVEEQAKAPNKQVSLDKSMITARTHSVENYAKQILQNKVDGKGNRFVKGTYLEIAKNIAKLKQVIGWGRIAALVVVAATILLWGYKKISVSFKVRARNERIYSGFLVMTSCFAVLITVGIFISLFVESIHFFTKINIFSFLFGTEWNVQSGDKYGAIPLFIGTILVGSVAMAFATPIGLLSAVYMSEYASPKMRAILKPALEILAGIPTVVYGFFAVVTVGPIFKSLFNIRGDSIIVAGLVMGIMIIPYISSLSDDVISAVPQRLRDGALGLGSTQSETISRVVFPAALPGIIGGILLAISRAIGETMIVVMALSRAPSNKLFPPLSESTTTVTVTIVDALTGDTEFGSPKVLSAYALALTLFLATLALNIFALYIVRKYRETYD
ncbi:MAG: phosphate ABC transporter permease subunit PstC [Alphaproteobacteria bacterium]